MENLNNTSDIVLSSKVCFIRNVKELPFPNKLDYKKGRELGEKIYNILNYKMCEEKIKLYELWNTGLELCNEYMEKRIITKELIKNKEQSSFIINQQENFCVMINEENHIKLQIFTQGLNLEKALIRITDIDDEIEENFNYAFNEKLGYLTASPTNIGTGMRASVIMHLPALTMNEEITNISKSLTKIGMTIKGIYTEGSSTYGNIYEISNQVSLGITEEKNINDLKEAVLNIISEEKKFREILLNKCKYELEDKIYRAYSILKSAVLLDDKETIDFLSSVRFGVEISLLDIDKNILNKLLTITRKYSLQNYLEKSLESQQIKYERAKVVKEILT